MSLHAYVLMIILFLGTVYLISTSEQFQGLMISWTVSFYK